MSVEVSAKNTTRDKDKDNNPPPKLLDFENDDVRNQFGLIYNDKHFRYRVGTNYQTKLNRMLK